MASLEIIDLIQQNLEEEGILTKIRAQLLASVVNILNGKENNNNNELKDPIKNFISTEQGKTCFQIVADLLSVLKMNATLSVFLNECGVEYSDKIRSNLSQSIGVSLSTDKPIMLTILESGVSHSTKSSPNSKSEEKEKEKEKAKLHNEKHNQSLKPVSNTRHRKGGHMEPDSLMDSDLEASTSSISSITSHGSGKGLKNLAPLAPLGGGTNSSSVGSLNKNKDLPVSLTQSNFPSHSGNLKHLSPLAPLGNLPPSNFPPPANDKLSGLSSHVKSPENSLKRSSPTLESLDKPKLSIGNNLDHSYDDDKVPLSPYDGKKERETDDLEYSVPESIPESASFEESSKVSFEQSQKEESKNLQNEKLTIGTLGTNNPGFNRVEVTNKNVSKHFHDDDSDEDNTDIDNIPSLGKNTNVIQSSAQVTRSTKGWNNSPDKPFSPNQQFGVDTEFETSHISEYAESFEESLASASANDFDASPIRPTNNIKNIPQDSNKNIQPVKTIDDLLSDDDDDDDDNNNDKVNKNINDNNGNSNNNNKISPKSQTYGQNVNDFDDKNNNSDLNDDGDNGDGDDIENDDFGEVRSSRADSVDTISRQRTNNQKMREAFGNQNKSLFNKKTDLLSPNESDNDGDDIYGQVENSPQYDDPSHSAILDESGEQDHNELSFSRRSNQEEENDIDFLAITRGSNIKKALNSNTIPTLSNPSLNATNKNTTTLSSPNPNNRSKRSEEDDDDYGDDDFEDGDNDDQHSKNHHDNDDHNHGDDESYIESLDEEIEEAEEDENEFSFGGASSGDEDMLNRKEKNNSKLPTTKSGNNNNNNNQGNRSTSGTLSRPSGGNVGGGKYDHNSSDDEDLYMPSSRRTTNEPEKKTIAKTDQNSDDEDDEDNSYFPTNSKPSGSLFNQKPNISNNNNNNFKKTSGPKYDDNSRDEDEFEDVPETGSAGSDFSAGDGGSDGESFLHEESMDRLDFDHKVRGDSNDFSMSEQEISGSHGLDGYDYTTNALPPARRLGGR